MTPQQREALIHARYSLDRVVAVIVGDNDIVLSVALEKAIWNCIDAINDEIPEDKPTYWSDLASERLAEIRQLKNEIIGYQSTIRELRNGE